CARSTRWCNSSETERAIGRSPARRRSATRSSTAHLASRECRSCRAEARDIRFVPMTTESRTALITGASSGIGAAIALEMATRGWKLAIGARRSDRLAETAEKARAQGAAKVYAGNLDVADDASVERFFEAS